MTFSVTSSTHSVVSLLVRGSRSRSLTLTPPTTSSGTSATLLSTLQPVSTASDHVNKRILQCDELHACHSEQQQPPQQLPLYPFDGDHLQQHQRRLAERQCGGASRHQRAQRQLWQLPSPDIGVN